VALVESPADDFPSCIPAGAKDDDLHLGNCLSRD
jgi:hypothetical protein